VNKTRYEFSFSIPDGQRHLGPPMRLETSNGAREYTLPEGPRFGPHTRFMFRVSPGDRNLVLRIPYLLVSNPFKPPWADEELQYVSLPLPVDGQKIPINRKVDFGDSVMTIVDAERQPGNVINMSLQVENRLPHKILFHAYLRSVNFWGTEKEDGGSGEWIFDENGLPAAVRYHLANSDSGTLRLSVQYPNYYLVGDYVLELDRYLQKAKSPAP
jgi:hypothetical protein